MKLPVLGLIVLINVSIWGQQSKLDLLCNSWAQTGRKELSDSLMRPITIDCAKFRYTFLRDGTFLCSVNCADASGIWACNSDSTRLEIQMTTFQNLKLPAALHGYYPDIIVKLTADTLILGTEYTSEKDNIITHGRTDLYYVRENK
jgi:hypothetical protein